MNPVQQADQAAHRLNFQEYTSQKDEIETLDLLRVAMSAIKETDAKQEYVQAFQTHANERTFLVACHQKKFPLAQMIHQTASLQLEGLVTKEGFSPMHMAADAGDVEFMKYLEKFNVQLDSITEKGWTPLHLACLKGRVESIGFLLEKGANTKQLAGPQKMDISKLVEMSQKQEAIDLIAKIQLQDK